MPESCLEGAHYIDEMWMFWSAVPAVVALFRMFDLRKANITTIFGWLLMPVRFSACSFHPTPQMNSFP